MASLYTRLAESAGSLKNTAFEMFDIGANSANKGSSQRKKVPFNPDLIPPDLDLAEKHLKATLVGYPKEDADDLEIDPDSGRYVEQNQFSVCCDKRDLKSLGSGYPLYFDFIEWCIILLFLAICITGFYNVWTNYKGDDCNGDAPLPIVKKYDHHELEDVLIPKMVENCQRGFSTRLSLANKRFDTYFTTIQLYLNMIYAVVIVISLHVHRASQRRLDEELHDTQLTAQDYSVWIWGLPPPQSAGAQTEELKNFLAQNGIPGRRLNLCKVVLAYDLEQYYKLETKKQNVIEDIKIAMKHRLEKKIDHPHIIIEEKRKSVEYYEAKLEGLRNEFELGSSMATVGHAFVTFSSMKDAEDFLEYYQPQTFMAKWLRCGIPKLMYKGCKLQFAAAPKPSDIFWENLHLSNWSKSIRRGFSSIVKFGILLLSWCLITLASYKEEFAEKDENTHPLEAQAIAVTASLAIFVINSCLSYTIKALASFEGYSTKTEYYVSIASKLAIAQFINTALVTLFVKAIVKFNLWGTGGLIQSMTIIFLSNSILEPLQSIFDVSYFCKLYQRNSLRNDGQAGRCFSTQSEVHKVFEGMDFEIANKYAGIIRIMYTTAFYSPLIPISIVWSVLALIGHYFADKYVLVRRCKRPNSVSAKFSKEMTELLEWLLPIYAAGNVFFNGRVLSVIDNKILAIIFILGLLNAMLPMDFINKLIVPPRRKTIQTKNYEEAMLAFEEDYDRSNPATRTKAITNFKDLIEKSVQQQL